ncbi:MAG: hypothetical protein EAZ47_07550 [Bacteroidetes bacterium]|nr:MAG: hypothetical protein EAY72_07850 [Bacteroidota bacterium]TAE59334.1 MAG: hypothetical protein EAY68_10910 [Bacteroidota bacterium]TAF93073.1 MAG: hypothetical protein EAZ47_07550 [Bacteroidota bacterium]
MEGNLTLGKQFCFWAALLLFTACNPKKPTLNGDTPVTKKEFFEAFTPLTIPTSLVDSSIARRVDTADIAVNILAQFIPDTALHHYGKFSSKKSSIHGLGSIQRGKEWYILLAFQHKKKYDVGVFLFDEKGNFVTHFPLKNTLTEKENYQYSIGINKEPTFSLSQEQTTGGTYLFTRTSIAYNSSTKQFMVVMSESNENKKKQEEIINPLDTLPQLNKWSGDYRENKTNFISIRDGKNANEYSFFLHFEKNEKTCVAEIKASLKVLTATTAVYQKTGDACVLNFSLKGNTISIKENGTCGNYRGIKCLFNESYTKVKVRPATKNKSSKTIR